jgi:DNA-binding NarL/FixJ family response regulator
MIEDAVTSSLNRQHGKVQSSSSHSESPSHSGVDAHVKQLVLRLSPRQREVLSLLLMGHTSKDVADKLNMSEVTAGNHVQRIFKNFSVSTRSALMALFVRDSEE